MDFAVASVTERNEVFLDITSQQASPADVMDLEIIGAAAVLTSPSVSLQDLSTQFAVGIRVQPKPRPLWS
jgi:hypothetical protein